MWSLFGKFEGIFGDKKIYVFPLTPPEKLGKRN